MPASFSPNASVPASACYLGAAYQSTMASWIDALDQMRSLDWMQAPPVRKARQRGLLQKVQQRPPLVFPTISNTTASTDKTIGPENGRPLRRPFSFVGISIH